MNWKAFEYKYEQRETWAFEQMTYFLFCAEFENRIGLFRYKNQAGIETDPIEKDGKHIGFQSKYYTTSISSNKEDIIDAIKKAKSKNDELDEIFIYINQELSESKIKDQKKPKYQIEIEKQASDIGLEITWRVKSHLELQLNLPENKYINDIYFSLESNLGVLIDQIAVHNDSILKAIQTEISINDKKIKIDRSEIIDQISHAVDNKKNIILSGEGGSGKTAIFKDFYQVNMNTNPICLFKANEFNVNHINDIFRFDHSFTLTQFLEAYKDEPLKTFVIDSAEKLAEISNNDIIIDLIHKLKSNGWNIIFTTRYGYLNDLSFHIRENYKLSFEVFDILLISANELKSISEKFNFALPKNFIFSERLRNLFYLSEYIQQYSSIDTNGNLRSFINLLWKKKIQDNLNSKDNLHLQRESSIINIVKQRCITGRFYINGSNLSQTALFRLKQDEILGYSEAHNGYFITHDIYEEWALDKIVSQCYANFLSTENFFNELGNSLPIRRAFRLWLSVQLSESPQIKGFIEEAFINTKISQFWKDEILVSVLLSDYSSTFFELFESELIAEDFTIIKRILFLLQVACTDISTNKDLEVIKPKGIGWEETIKFIDKYKAEFFDANLQLIIPILKSWSNYTNTGKASKISGLLALRIIEKTEVEKKFYIQDELEEKIFRIVFSTSYELKDELISIFNIVVNGKWTKYNAPYERFCSTILEKPYLAIKLIKELPNSVIQLCDFFWQKQIIEIDKDDPFPMFENDSLESRYGLNDSHRFNYFPASANQTPIRWLLESDFYKTLEFIINFTNRSVKTYSQSDYGKEDVQEITLNINNKKITQYSSKSIWSMYRGAGSPVTPYLLQSIHMALESVLLDVAKVSDIKILNNVFLKILLESKSTSLTAIVTSIVLANPDILFETALILFHTLELFPLDSSRAVRESEAETIHSIGYGMDKFKDIFYADERLKTSKDQHRNSSIKSLFVKYQYFGVKDFTEKKNNEFIEKLYQIIDFHLSDTSKSDVYEILLANIDRRNLEAKVIEGDKNDFIIEFKPKELSEEQEEKIEKANNEFSNNFKYTPLMTWSNFLHKTRSENKPKKHLEYDQNPLRALSETRDLIEELKVVPYDSLRFFDYAIPGLCCSKLMIEHKELLSKEDKLYCKEFIIDSLSRLFEDNYNYQIGDGTEASVHAIPALIDEYPSEIDVYIQCMVYILLDKYSLGHYKRICDYVIESIYKAKLWKKKHYVAQLILLNYIKIKPTYKSIISEKRKQINHWQNIPKSFITEELDKRNLESSSTETSYDIFQNLNLLDLHDLEIVYQLIPPDTTDKTHLDIYAKSLSIITPLLLIEQRDYEKRTGDKQHIHLERLYIFQNFASFILHRDIEDIDQFLAPFIKSFSTTEETASFISEILGAEDRLYKYDTFWYVWDKLYPSVKQLSKTPRNYSLKGIIINYLLAWRWWPEDLHEWHSLKTENINLYAKAAKDMGHVPSVLYSISCVLNSIAYDYIDEGISWIYTITSNHPSLSFDDLESITLDFLEDIMRRYIFINRDKIKKEVLLKNKVITILDFMIERGSIHAYLLRESTL